MTKKEQQLAATVEYNDDDDFDDEEVNHGNDDNDEDDDDEIIEAKYEKYRDDQTNTGVIAALLGGFALTNSWEMDVSGEECTTIDLTAYCLAIFSVHAFTCSALTSAFLYRSLTKQATPREGLEWLKRHHSLAQGPWYKFIFGTLCYLVSVILVAWSALGKSTGARAATLAAGISGCVVVCYTIIVVHMDAHSHSDPDTDPRSNKTSAANKRGMPPKRIPNSKSKRMKKKPIAARTRQWEDQQ